MLYQINTIMQKVNDFFNKLASEIRSTYFPNEKHGYTQNMKYHASSYAIELFNNGCITVDRLINKLSKNCKDSKENIEKIVNKYFISDELIKEVEKEVLEYSNDPIMYTDNPIPSNHLFAVRGKLCDFYQITEYVVVYIK